MIIVRPILAVALAIAPAATQPRTNGQQLRLTPDEIRALPSIRARAGASGVGGIITRVLAGDPKASGPYTIALVVPANTEIAAHTHIDDRVATVISGTWFSVTGPGPATGSRPWVRSFYTEPASVAHFARTGGKPVTLYIHGFGPTDTHYLDISADPRRQSGQHSHGSLR